MADQVREQRVKFEAWASKQGYDLDSMTCDDGEVEYYASETWALWGCWQAATASHAAEVETLRALLKSLADEFCRVYPIYYYAEPWGHNTNGPLLAARAALKVDKP